jgi:intein/homing endonuclease
MKMGGSINSYTYIKAIAEEMRGLAMEFDIPIITATQINREGSKSSDPALEDTSECIYVNEEIELRDGTKKLIGDVKLGDQIKANDDYKTVMMVHHKKMKQCYKIKLKSGKEIIVSEDHVFPTDKGRISIKTGLKSGVKLNTKN